MYVYMYTFMTLGTYECTYIRMYICIHFLLCVYIRTYVCMHVLNCSFAGMQIQELERNLLEERTQRKAVSHDLDIKAEEAKSLMGEVKVCARYF